MKIIVDGKITWVNYHHLFCFYTVVLKGGLSGASKALEIGQSALSIQMKQFEDQLGFTLFERGHRKLVVNERGRLVLHYANEIFRLGGEMVHALNDRRGADRVHFQIGSMDTISKHLIVQLVSRALGRNSTVTVLEGKSDELLKDLMEHRIDLLVTNFLPKTAPAQVFAKRIARLPLWIVGGKSFVRLRRDFPKSLNGQPFIVPTGDSRVRHEFESFRMRSGIVVDNLVETQDIMVQKILAKEEVGLSVMPEFAVKEFLKKKELFLIGKIPGAFEEILLLAASRKIENPVAAEIMKGFDIVV